MSIPAGLLGFPENIGPKAAVELKFSLVFFADCWTDDISRSWSFILFQRAPAWPSTPRQ